MRDDRRNYIVVGTFVIGLVAALIAWIVALSGFLGRTDPYSIVYRNVTGLSAGTEVLFEGYRIGMIEGIEAIAKDGHPVYRVGVSVRRGWPIPEDSEAAIEAPSLLAAVAIDIKAGSSSAMLSPGDEIAGRELANVMASASAMVDQVNEFIADIRPTLDSLTERAPEVVENVFQFTEDVNTTVTRVNEMLGPEARERIRRILTNMDAAVNDAATFAGELRQTREQVDSTLARVDALIARNEPNVDRSLKDLQDSLAAVSSRIDAISYNLEATTRNMNEFSREIRSNPGLIIRGRESGEEPAGELR